MACYFAQKCPKCERYAVFFENRVVDYKGKKYGPVVWKCDACGAEESNEDIEEYIEENFIKVIKND